MVALEGEGAEAGLAPGRDVEIRGTAMNASLGVLETWLEDKGRWKVKFPSGITKNFKPENLAAATAEQAAKRRKLSSESAGNVDSNVDGGASASSASSKVGSSVSELLSRIRGESTGGSTMSMVPGDIAPAVVAAEEPRSETADSSTTPGPDSKKRRRKEAAAEKKRVEEATVVADAAASGSGAQAVNLAGRAFGSRADLVEHVRSLQTRLDGDAGEQQSGPPGMLQGEDRFLLFHLALRHPRTAEKLRAPLRGVRYGVHPAFPANKCFILVFADGTEEPVSWMKCVKELFGQGDSAVKRKGAGGAEVAAAEEPEAEPTRAERPLQLVGEAAAACGATHADRWVYPLMDERKRSFAGYLSCPIDKDLLSKFYENASSGTTWCQPLDPRSEQPIPRKTAWMVTSGLTCTYRYGGVDVSPQIFPAWMHELMEVYMPLCGLTSRDKWPNSCNLNLYVDGTMSVGWHADDEKLFKARYKDARIISLSLGETRTFELRPSILEDEGAPMRPTCRMNLHNGDLCTMEGMTQKHYQHRVPKDGASGPRINLTWRWVV